MPSNMPEWYQEALEDNKKKVGGHPDANYLSHVKTQKIEEGRRWWAELRGKKNTNPMAPTQSEFEKPKRKIPSGKIIVGLLVVLAAYYLYTNPGKISDVSNFLNQTEHNITAQIIPNSSDKSMISSVPSSPSPYIAPTITGKPSIDTTQLELDIHSLINTQRQNNGLQPLQFDTRLQTIARAHSKDMANNGFFSHVNLVGQDPTARAAAVGYTCHKDFGSYYTNGIAENIFQNNLYNQVWYTDGIPTSYDWNDMNSLASSTVEGWMNSPGHRENILTPTYDREGLGVAISSDDKVYITEDFC